MRVERVEEVKGAEEAEAPAFARMPGFFARFWLQRLCVGTRVSTLRVVESDALRSKLDEFRDETELCDQNGNLIGIFKPAADPNRRWYEWAKGRHTAQDEIELDRIAAEPGAKATAEVLESLRAP